MGDTFETLGPDERRVSSGIRARGCHNGSECSGAIFIGETDTMRTQFHLYVECDNAAFDDRAREVARILRHVIDKVEEGRDTSKLYDLNGNHVGYAGFSRVGYRED